MTGEIVVLHSDCNGVECEPQLFDSVSSAAVWFANMMIRRMTGGKRLTCTREKEKVFNAVVADVALLFAGYDRTTEKDPEQVHAGNASERWSMGLDSVSSMEQVLNELHEQK